MAFLANSRSLQGGSHSRPSTAHSERSRVQVSRPSILPNAENTRAHLPSRTMHAIPEITALPVLPAGRGGFFCVPLSKPSDSWETATKSCYAQESNPPDSYTARCDRAFQLLADLPDTPLICRLVGCVAELGKTQRPVGELEGYEFVSPTIRFGM